MEVWILLAAAGSGYLARRWQNSQKPKGLSADEAEDDNSAGPSLYMPSNRGQYRHFSSSGRRQVGKSLCGKGNPYWVRSRNPGNPSEYRAGNRVMGGEGGKKISREGHICEDAANICGICSDARVLNPVQASHGGSTMKLNQAKHENVPAEEAPSESFSSRRVSNSCESKARCVFQDAHEEDAAKGHMSADSSQSLMFRSVSGKRANDSLDGKVRRGGQLHLDGYAGKRMKDAMDNTNTANPDGACALGSWMPGFWDVSEGLFVLDTESLLVQQGERSRGSSSSRRSRTPNKYGKSRGSRKKNLAGQKPMSSLESCLSAQLDEDYNRWTTQSREQFRNLGKQPISHAGSLASEGKVSASRMEFAIGLPSLSRQSSTKRFPSKSRTPQSFRGKAFSEDTFNPFANSMYNIVRSKEKCSDAANEGSKYKKGRAGSSIQGLLFNFGVGVGMMFTLMSNMREVRRLTLLLKEAELLIKDLEDELERKDEMGSDSDAFKNKGVGVDAASEQRQSFVTNTLRKVRSATESLCSMRMILTNESVSRSTIQHGHSKDMSKLEAELEAELERMELSLGEGDVLKFRSKSTGSSEHDGEVGDLVRGELTILGLPHEVEVDSEDEDSSSSSHEDLHARNYAVSPRALAKRLHEVLEAQQEERISELEAELKLLNSKLQAREEEVKWMKDNSRGLSGDAESISEVDKKPQQSLQNRLSQKYSFIPEGLSNTGEQCRKLQVPQSPNASPVSPYTTSIAVNNVSVFKKGIEDKSAAFIALGGDALAAYKEACDEFSKVSIDAPVRSFSPKSRKPERQGKEASIHEGKVDAKHLGSSDGWEQVDLLSLAEDFYVGGDPELLENMPTLTRSSVKERRCPRRKSRIKGHPEPEQLFSSSRGVDSSDDATNDTSVSTPCSVKFMDVRTVGYCQSEDKQGGEGERDISLPSYCDWSREILIRAGVNTPNQEEDHSNHPALEDSSGEFLPSKQGNWGLPDDSEYYSELDDQLGQLLIKRIVEKSRKGSPIIQDAQTVLEYLEKNEPTQAVN
eukprot:c23529_g1_i1 orf=398-3490(-)